MLRVAAVRGMNVRKEVREDTTRAVEPQAKDW